MVRGVCRCALTVGGGAGLANVVDGVVQSRFGFSTGLIFSGTVFILIFAYTVRFLAVSLQSVESGLGGIHASMDQAALSMGKAPLGVLKAVHLPMMKGTLLTAVLLVFVDVLKELPATIGAKVGGIDRRVLFIRCAYNGMWVARRHA